VTSEIVRFNEPPGLEGIASKAPSLFLRQARAAERFFDFFTANIRDKHTRRAYYNGDKFRVRALSS
jgi:hypothetical protein